MKTFSFAVSKDFATNANITVLTASITTNMLLIPSNINATGDSAIRIIFAVDLTTNQLNQLYTIVSQWDTAKVVSYSLIVPIYFQGNGISTTSYQRYGAYGYLGYNSIALIKKIKIVGKMDIGVLSYDVRIYDATNSVVVAEANYSNTTEQLLDLGTISNLSPTQCILEIHLRKNGGSGSQKVYSEMIIFYS